MKSGKIIVGFLVLLGFGGCCNRPSKSKQQEPAAKPEIVVDTTRVAPIVFMYSARRADFRPLDSLRVGEQAPEIIQPATTPDEKPAERSE